MPSDAADAEAAGDDLGEHVAVVVGPGYVALVERLGARPSQRPCTPPATPPPRTRREPAVAVVGAAVGVLLDPPAELAHRHDRRRVQAVAEVLGERGQLGRPP